ncbi:multi antimicrobial extrusion protein MatE [Salipaludibacillus neizhouensis]|uniref:Multi antimicrobial extrusion protein MatE n=1 Tax=Salipaludibacillus neizhouensis TaxID=885475 RepID=A0A3A9K9G9_9BACI|nr:multi antimicrobial extrusion protein MatE [Salipaludibacillus neizhouensis]RKL67172.1 multi antimicrobial extrusion protein MatE [Salipaludibacillus neizhouensis]
MANGSSNVSYNDLIAFFIPLGISSSLTAVTHVIINGTLSRGEDAAFIIACYAVAHACFGLVEKPLIVFRQTSSALVTDMRSFKALAVIFVYVSLIMISISMAISFTPIGNWVFIHLFNADYNMVNTISLTFSVISLVIIVSGIRGIYQGVIISHFATKWLTVGVIVRLAGMFLVSFWFVYTDQVTSMAGAAIFLIGMFIECVVSVWKGHLILKKTKQNSDGLKMKDIMPFYLPLVFYFLLQTLLQPIIYVFLTQSSDIEMSIASFALAFAISQLMLSFFMYTHQLVLQYYQADKEKVRRFIVFLSLIPALLLSIMSFTPVGMWFMKTIMGAEDSLAEPTLIVLQFFILKVLIFPWVDFFNGFIMLQRQTRNMVIAQTLNLLVVFTTLSILVSVYPQWNGVNGAISASVGELAGLIGVLIIVHRNKLNGKRLQNKALRAK